MRKEMVAVPKTSFMAVWSSEGAHQPASDSATPNPQGQSHRHNTAAVATALTALPGRRRAAHSSFLTMQDVETWSGWADTQLDELCPRGKCDEDKAEVSAEFKRLL